MDRIEEFGKIDEQILARDMDSPLYTSMFMKKLEFFKRKKEVMLQYNAKQGLIEALKQVGVSENFAHNEVLLQYLGNEVKSKLQNDDIMFCIDDELYLDEYCVLCDGSHIKREDLFANSVTLLAEYLKNKYTINEDKDCSSISIIKFKDNEIDVPKITTDMDIASVVEEVKKFYCCSDFILPLQKDTILFDYRSNQTTITSANYDLGVHFNELLKISSQFTENQYDALYRMVTDKEVCFDGKANIRDLEQVAYSLYTDKREFIASPTEKVGKYSYMSQDERKNFESENIHCSWTTVGIDFYNMFQDINPDQDEVLERQAHFNYADIWYYHRQQIPESDYSVEWNDPRYYSIIHDFSKDTIDTIDEIEKIKRYWY